MVFQVLRGIYSIILQEFWPFSFAEMTFDPSGAAVGDQSKGLCKGSPDVLRPGGATGSKRQLNGINRQLELISPK
jgi:hypothetical protein